ncbi:MAG: NAD(P)/FAD-dependent oxidoreductase [Nannocystaceae bacterium]
MAHTPMFSRLRRLARRALWARRQGATTVEEVDALAATGAARGLSRRGLGHTAALAVAALATGAGGCGDDGDDASAGESGSNSDAGGHGEARVVVVGGGVAGIHCAYRLAQAGVRATVYDAWSRIGGRTYSTSEGAPAGMVLELGGEFIDTNHATLWQLAGELGIDLDDRHDGVPSAEVWWVDGAAVPEATILAQLVDVAPQLVADFEAAEADDAAYEALDRMTLKGWLETYAPLATHRELHVVLDVAYRGEYGLENAEQSALNLIYLLGDDTDDFRIFGDSDERYHAHGGNQRFVTEMAATLDDAQIVLERRLVAARDGDAGGFVLTFADASGGEVEVEADHVVFALPYNLLRACDLSGLTLSAEKRTIIDELGYGTNAKVMGNFTSPVWRDVHGSSGSVTADLGFQQSWDTSIGQGGPEGIMTDFLGGQAGLDCGEGTAEAWYTGQVLPALEAIFPGAQAAYIAGSAARMHWPTAPHHRGSYTCYKPGQWAFWALEGVREGDLHFCGEHCSPEFQGWMEGAAETGGLVAAEILDDLGVAASPAHRALIDRLTARAPHPCYHGDRAPRLRWAERRRLLRRRGLGAL